VSPFAEAWGGLSRRRRIVVALGVALSVWHLGTMLTYGNDRSREVTAPVTGFYVDGLRAGILWGMFVRAPSHTDVLVQVERADGSTVDVSSVARGSFATRFVDARLRKLQERFNEPGWREWLGPSYLAWWCRALGGVEAAFRLDTPELLDDAGRVATPASREVVQRASCR
jgi:hypothetical protein